MDGRSLGIFVAAGCKGNKFGKAPPGGVQRQWIVISVPRDPHGTVADRLTAQDRRVTAAHALHAELLLEPSGHCEDDAQRQVTRTASRTPNMMRVNTRLKIQPDGNSQNVQGNTQLDRSVFLQEIVTRERVGQLKP